MNGALLRSSIQCADSGQHRGLAIRAGRQGVVRIFYGGSSCAPVIAIAQAALLILAIALDLGLDVCQGRSSK